MQDDFQFELFGPLTVRHNGNIIEIPRAKHRVVLATLLLQANRVITAEELIQQLWGSNPPATARKTLQGYIARLRKALGAELLVSRAAGYAIVVAADQVDLNRFDTLLAQAEQATEPHDRARLLRAAMSEARGTPLVDISSDYLKQGDGAALVERWLNATEQWAEAEMAVGRHADVLPRLRSLVSEHPFRETAWWQLMVALFRAGRQADALGAYQEVRLLFAGELGVEPGEELRALHQQILAEPDTIAKPLFDHAPAHRGERPDKSPFTLPPSHAEFVRHGIEQEVTRALTAVRDANSDDESTPRIVALHGPAGIGKTTLAVRVAHAVSGHFPDGQLFVDLQESGTPREPVDVLREVVRALGIRHAAVPTDLGALGALYRSLLSRRRVLMVLDGAVSEAQVRPLIPAAPTSALLVSSLKMLPTLDSAHHVRFGLLSPRESVDILARIIGPDRVAAEERVAGQLAGLCGQLPLAIRIVAARLLARPHWRLAQLVDRLTPESRRLDELVAGDLSVRSSLEVSYRALDAPARRAFRLLSLLEMPSFQVHVAAAALNLPEDRTEELLEQVAAHHLLDAEFVKGNGIRFAYHDLVRLYARQRCLDEDPAHGRHETVERALAAWYSAPYPRSSSIAAHTDPTKPVAGHRPWGRSRPGRSPAPRLAEPGSVRNTTSALQPTVLFTATASRAERVAGP
ncbi:BTAD domain-containing putative transcriptional regulator [Nocardia sp. NPDC088792]|uniref:AfsR/SARP family transcriptional regulator n=1 Tax=Nocardia sp. NPDC088792 TaxID=3364332 RepID=UPI003821C614